MDKPNIFITPQNILTQAGIMCIKSDAPISWNGITMPHWC